MPVKVYFMLDGAEDRINRQKDANCQVYRLLTTFFRRLIHFLRICILIFNSVVPVLNVLPTQ